MRLIRKHAEVINGIDLKDRAVGERMPLPLGEAVLLVAEGWAEPLSEKECRTFSTILEVGEDD